MFVIGFNQEGNLEGNLAKTISCQENEEGKKGCGIVTKNGDVFVWQAE